MGVNRFAPHLYVIPEDDANRQMAIGFEKDFRISAKSIQILPPAGGWLKAIGALETKYYPVLLSKRFSHVLLLIDCDQDPHRIARMLKEVPECLKDRVFILGTLYEPEALRRDMRLSFEKIGETVASECFNSNTELWHQQHLKHNWTEVQRLKDQTFALLFDEK